MNKEQNFQSVPLKLLRQPKNVMNKNWVTQINNNDYYNVKYHILY